MPVSCRRRAIGALTLALLIAGSAIAAQQPPRYVERVEVARLIVDVRVLDDQGHAVTGLMADDFKVSIDGKNARVETATWMGGVGTEEAFTSAAPVVTDADSESLPRPGRLIVFLFQKDFESSRIAGLMRMLLKSREVIETMTPSDRVAILSFDSHLRIWTDFTNDIDRLDRILSHDLLLEQPPAIEAARGPSLVERLGPDKGRRTYGIERAMALIGEALEPLPGAKSLVLIGYGFGRLGPSGVAMENDFGPAREALVAARTSVFSLDVTNADYHSLEAGLQLVSEQTGGFYAKTHLFPDLAMRQLEGALAGYYALFVERPDIAHTVHDVKTELRRRGTGHVFALSSFSDKSR